MKKLILALALAFVSGPALAQASAPAPANPAPVAATPLPDADPALWVVRDADTTIYLFGTFHMLDGRPWFNDEVRTAFDASNELVLEAIVPENPAELGPMIMRYAIDEQGRTLSSRLSAEENAALARAAESVGVPAAAVDRMEPWFVAMTLASLASQRLGINAENGPETVLARAARERSVPVHELEGMEWQIRLFDTMPEAQQLAQLRSAIETIETIHEKIRPMLAAWSTGDVEALQRTMMDEEDRDEALHRLVFTDRNTTWAGWIQERMARPGTVFMAVGAGHLAGDDSVQAMLGQRGLRVERVPHVEAAAIERATRE